MARQFTTSDRVMLLMSLIPYLDQHGPTSVTELAAEFDVAPQALRQLVRFLGVAGVPGETQTYQHEDLFDIDWDALEQHDLVSLTHIVAVEETPRFSSVETSAMIAGLHVLTPMLPAHLQTVAQSTAEKLAAVQPIDGPRRSVTASKDPVHERLSEITSSMAQGQRLEFEYRDASGASTHRRVEPLLLSQSGDSWYLRAYCLDRSAERTFLLDRMRAVRMSEETADRAPLAAGTRQPGVDEAALTARIRLTPAALRNIADFAPRVTAHEDGGWCEAELELLHPAVAVRLVQAAPGELIVESPPAAREAVRLWAARALARYDV